MRIIVALVLLIIIGYAALMLISSHNYFKAQQFTQIVINLAIGASKSQIEELLKNEGMEYSYVTDRRDIEATSALEESRNE
jgi:uncharacterized membrane protein